MQTLPKVQAILDLCDVIYLENKYQFKNNGRSKIVCQNEKLMVSIMIICLTIKISKTLHTIIRMSYWDKDFEEWFRRLFGRRGGFPHRFGFSTDTDDLAREMERMFEEQFGKFPSKAPKEFVREYETPEGGKVREIGPIVYGYSVIIGPDGKPRISEFGNVKKSSGIAGPQLSTEREPMADVITSNKEVKVVIEIPGVEKQDIKIKVIDHSVDISTDTPDRKYHRVVEISSKVDLEPVSSTYKNGILELTFPIKNQKKGRSIKIE